MRARPDHTKSITARRHIILAASALLLACLAGFLFSTRTADAQSLVWNEDWESGIGAWTITNDSPHVWEVGAPGAGPSSAHGGSNCAGTILAGGYPGGADSRLISPPLTLPASPPGGKLWLSFWQWFQINAGDGDWGAVEISADNGATWVVLGAVVSGSSNGWVPMELDVSSWTGQTVQVGFRLVSGTWPGGLPGWYLDDISIGSSAMAILPPKPCIALALSAPSPNPARDDFVMTFALPDERNVHIAMLGPDGRCGATLVDGRFGPGVHQVRWSDLNTSRAHLASGVYFVRMTAGHDTRVRKFLCLR